MPVVTPSRASTEIVYAVRILSWLCGRHQRDLEPVEHVGRHRHADHAAGVPDRERHQLRGRLGGREDDVALVLAVLVVDDDDGLAGGDVGDRALDGVEADLRALLMRALPPVVSTGSTDGSGPRCGWRAARRRSPRSRGRRRRRTGSRSGSSWLCHSRRHADQVDGDPAPARSRSSRAPSRTSRRMRADEDPGVAPEVPARRRPAGPDHARTATGRAGAAGGPGHEVGRAARPPVAQRGVIAGASTAAVGPCDLLPAPPAVDADDDEEDLASGLPEQRLLRVRRSSVDRDEHA